MRWPELLYLPAPADVAKSIVAPERVAHLRSNAALFIARSFLWGPVPKDRALILAHMAANSIAGAGQTADRIELNITRETPPGSGVYIVVCRLKVQEGSGGLRLTTDWQGEVIVMGGDLVRATGDFNAAAVNNTFVASMAGVLVPRANIQEAALDDRMI